MFRKHIITKTIIYLLPLYIFSQSIKKIDGYIFDSQTKIPLENVDVYFNNNPLGNISNLNGYFNIEDERVSSNDTIIFSHIGYKEKRCKISDFIKESTHIFLDSETISLDEVIITPITIKGVLDEAINRFDSNHLNSNIVYIGNIIQVNKQDTLIKKLLYSDIALKMPKPNKDAELFLLERQFKVQEENTYYKDENMVKVHQLIDFLNIKGKLFYFIDNITSFDNSLMEKEIYGSKDIFKLTFEKNVTEDKKSTIIIYLDQDDYSILSLELKGDRGKGVDKWHTIKNDKKVKISRRPSYSSAKISFRPFKDKWVIKEVFVDLDVDYKIKNKKNEEHFKNYNYANIRINNFSINDTLQMVNNNSHKVNLKQDIFNQIIDSQNPSIVKYLSNKLNTKELNFVNKKADE